MNGKDELPLVFIGGCPRSGTTLMKRILDAHSDIFCGPEFGHLRAISELYKRMSQGIESGRITQYASKNELNIFIRQFILNFFQKVANDNNVKIVAEKTPDNVTAFCTLHELFPNAKFIHVIRNPLDVVASYQRVGLRMIVNQSEESHPKPYLSTQISRLKSFLFERKKKNQEEEKTVFNSVSLAAKNWKQQVYFPRRFGETFNSKSFQSNYLEVRYEDLVTNTEETVRQLCDFVGVSFEMGMLQLDRDLAGDSQVFGNKFYTKDEYISKISENKVGRWEDYLSPEEIKSVVEETEFYLIKYGYFSKQDVDIIINESK